MKHPYGRIAPAPHNPDNIPRNCWTCINHTAVLSGMTTCKHIGSYNNTKMGIEPCEHYDLNAVWIETDWLFTGKVEE